MATKVKPLNLTQRIAALAHAIGVALKTRITSEHPGVIQGWGRCGVVDTVVIGVQGFNVKSIKRLSRGKFRVTWQRPMPYANAWCMAQAFSAPSASKRPTPQPVLTCLTLQQTSRSMDLRCVDAESMTVDPWQLSFIVCA